MSKLLAAVLFAASVTACVDDPDLETSVAAFGGAGGGGLGNGTNELQGRLVLGLGRDGGLGNFLSTARLGTKVNTSTTFVVVGAGPYGNGSCLQATIGGVPHQCADVAFNGYEFAASSGATIQIVSSATFQTSTAPDPLRLATGYALSIGGQPYCPNNHLAFPINGVLARTGLSTPIAASFTWACSEFLPNGAYDSSTVIGNGVRAKAIAWGFPAEGPVLTTATTPISGADLQTTAVRVGRADYCYNGKTATIEGTSIGYADLVSGNLAPTQNFGDLVPSSPTTIRQPITDGQFYFEAAWRRPNPTAAGEDRARPLCLSKLRWSTLAVGDLCAGTSEELLDPRVNHAPGGDGLYCEDYGDFGTLANAGAVIVNTSQFNDVGLRVWKHAITGDNYTTTIGAYLVNKPAPMYDYQAHLGTLLTGTGRAVWTAAYPADAATFNAEPLKSCSDGSHHITAPASQIPIAYNVGCVVEGYYFATQPSAGLASLGLSAQALYLHGKPHLGEYLTNGDANAAGYATHVQLGWIIGPHTY